MPTGNPELDVVNLLQQSMRHGSSRLFHTVPQALRVVLEDEVWRQRPDKQGKPFQTFEQFVRYPLWWGLESTVDDLMAYCRTAPEVQGLIQKEMTRVDTHQEAGKKGGRGKKATYNVSSFHGNRANYTLRRLKLERPDLAEQVIAGALTAHAAALQAGFRKPTWTAPADPVALANTIAKKFPGWKMVREEET